MNGQLILKTTSFLIQISQLYFAYICTCRIFMYCVDILVHIYKKLYIYNVVTKIREFSKV